MVRLSALIALVVAAQPASAFTAQNGMTVSPVDAQSFVVHFPSPDAETQYLCAAGDFVIRGLGLPSSTRVFRASAPPRRQGQGITFTLDEGRKTAMGLFSSLGGQDDGGIGAGTARDTYCTVWRIFPRF